MFASHQIRHQATLYVKQAVNLMIADDHLIFHMGLCGYLWVNVLTFTTPENIMITGMQTKVAFCLQSYSLISHPQDFS